MGKRNQDSKSNWKKQRLIESIETFEKKYYIFCEGEKTEPNYFEGIKSIIERNALYKNSIFINIDGVGADTVRIINAANEYVKSNDINNADIWIVYDKDSFPDVDFNNVALYAERLNHSQDKVVYKVAWSNQCIEFWFILHFDYYIANNDRTYYIKYLNNKFKELKIGKYKKNDPDIFFKLAKYGDPELAIKYAEKILSENIGKSDSNKAPATMVHKLFSELYRYLKM